MLGLYLVGDLPVYFLKLHPEVKYENRVLYYKVGEGVGMKNKCNLVDFIF